jgi:hypothetical protein
MLRELSTEAGGSYRGCFQNERDVAGGKWERLRGILHAEEFVKLFKSSVETKDLNVIR